MKPMKKIKANARIGVERDTDLAHKNLKLKKLGYAYDKLLLTTDSLYKHYKAKEVRILLKDSQLF